MQKQLYLSLFIFAIIVSIFLSGQPADASTSSGFQVKNGVLKDSKGNSFVIRGINNPHIWYDTKAYNALDEIAKTGANTVRIVWDTTGSASRLEEIIKRCIELNMIAMPELHCATGTDCTEKIKDRARYWARDDVSAVLKKYQEYVIVNIANEPGYSRYNSTLTDEVWRDVYKECIDIMRNAGIDNTIVIDARSYGQDYYCVAKYGQDLIDYDPLHNLMFGIHMYVEWNDRNKIIEKLDLLKSKNLPIVIAEFGYNYNNGNNNLHCKVDAQTILDECEKHGFGYMAWSWAGNNQENAWLDMTYDWVNYTEWGEFLVNGRNGIKQTSKICSVFKETSEQKITLSVCEGSLNPPFDSDVANYSVIVAHDVGSIKITATISDANASLTIDGITTENGVARTVFLREQGTSTQIDIVATAEDGETVKTYTITVKRLNSEQTFPDVPPDHPFFTKIEALAESGIAEGYDDGKFRPTSNITRMAMAAFLVRGLELEGKHEVPAEPTFPDVPIDHPFYEEIGLLAASGITEGYDDGTFRPSANVTRMAMAAFLSRALELDQDYEGPTQSTFSDVSSDHPFYVEIELLAASGIAEGYDDGTFRPSANVTRMAMAAFLFRGLELE